MNQCLRLKNILIHLLRYSTVSFIGEKMNAKALVRINFPTKKQMVTAFNAISPDVCKSVQTRSKLQLEKEGTFLVLEIEASDTVALRSALNAYLRWLDSIKNILLLLETWGSNSFS
jgi:tRNA threonylcarbamoyladenosine modification (KEOPS) complex  Pcc1 subunit